MRSDNGESTQRRERGRERGRWMKREATQYKKECCEKGIKRKSNEFS